MESSSQPWESDLFLVRVWMVEGADGSVGWRGRVQHVVSGETHTYSNWSELLDWLTTMLGHQEVPEPCERRQGDDR